MRRFDAPCLLASLSRALRATHPTDASNRLRSRAQCGRGLALSLLVSTGCARPPQEIPIDVVQVSVKAQDTAWSAAYLFQAAPGAVREVATGREVHLPLGANVELSLESRDFICLFAMPGLQLRDFAAPGVAGRFQFRAERSGSYEFRGDEMCGLPHTEKTRGRFVIEEPAAFQAWVHDREKESR